MLLRGGCGLNAHLSELEQAANMVCMCGQFASYPMTGPQMSLASVRYEVKAYRIRMGDWSSDVYAYCTASLKPRLHQIHVAGYKYPGLATCIRLHVDGYKF